MKNFFEIDRKTGTATTRPLSDVEKALKNKSTFIWVDCDESMGKKDARQLLAHTFQFHPWTIAQSLNGMHRPKLEQHDDYLFIIVPSLVRGTTNEHQEFTALNVYIGKNFLVTVHDKPLQSTIDVSAEVPRQDSLLHGTPGAVLYQLMTEVVDDYRPIIEHLDSEVDIVEQSIFTTADPNVQKKIFGIKKHVLGLRRSVQPLREVINLLTNREFSFIDNRTRLMFRDTYDQMLRVYDELETFRELMSSAMDSYISQVSNRLNEIMKILSAVATILLPLTLISGIWGTNFRHLPGINDPNGFWIMIGSMVVLGIITASFFRWRKWF